MRDLYTSNTIEKYIKKVFTPVLFDFNIEYIDFDLSKLLKSSTGNVNLEQIEGSYSGFNLEDKKCFVTNVEMYYYWCVKTEWGTEVTQIGTEESMILKTKLTLHLSAMKCFD